MANLPPCRKKLVSGLFLINDSLPLKLKVKKGLFIGKIRIHKKKNDFFGGKNRLLWKKNKPF